MFIDQAQQLPGQMAISQSMPAPVGGWNTRDPLESMALTDAVTLTNIFPSTRTVSLRRGYREHADGMGSGAVETLAEHVAGDGTKKLVAAANGNIYDCTTFGASATSKGSGFTSNRFQTTLFRNVLILVNGADTPQQFDGTTLSNAVYTGTGLTPANVLLVTQYKKRLYLAMKDDASIWYGGVNAITGATTEFDVGSLIRGPIAAISTWTFASGAGLDEHFVILSEEGDLLVYAGDDPSVTSGDDRWRLVGHAILPRPIGNRCFVKVGTQQFVITERGLIPLTAELFEYQSANSFLKISDKIDDAWITLAGNHNGNFGWQGLVYPRGPWLLINVPVVGNGTTEQLVMNQQTGAWCKFTNINSNCWVLHNEQPYFGGTDGKVYQADYGQDDNDGTIPVELQTSFTNFGNPQQLKLLHLGRPVMEATVGTEFLFEAEVDFQTRSLTDTISVSGVGGTPWGSAWGSSWGALKSNIKDWYSIAGLGRYCSLRLKGNYKDVEFRISSFDVQFSAGGTL